MDQDEKRRFLERHERASKKYKTFEQRKRLKEEARRKRAERRKGSRPRWRLADDDDGAHFEKLRHGAHERAPVTEASAGESSGVLEEALVVSVARGRAQLELHGEALAAPLPPGLGLAVGDRVEFERRAGGLVLVRAVLPRASWLARPDPAHPERRLVLAANVERIACVVAARQPRWKPGFVDRVLLAAEEGRTRVLLVVNKIDLLADTERRELGLELAPYADLGVEACTVSAATGEGMEHLCATLTGGTVALVGPSGAGKSSLLNALDPGQARATGAVRRSDGKGRHTTSASELVTLASGTRLIDTPGVRQFGLDGLDRRALASYFPELRAVAARCRFRDCSHLVEPGCAVGAAVLLGEIAPRRFAAYRRIFESLPP